MSNEPLTFNDLPQVVAELRDEVSGMKALLLNLQNNQLCRERTDTALSHLSRSPSAWKIYGNYMFYLITRMSMN